MKLTGFHSSGGDESGDFDSDRIRGADDAQNRLLEQALNARGAQLRDRAGLADRVMQSNPRILRMSGMSGSATHSPVGSIESWKARWGMGLAIAASLVAAVFVTDVFEVRDGSANRAVVASVASTDQSGTISEQVLVSLLAGSEVVTDGGDHEFVVDGASAMPVLRLRDASFGDLNSEVQLTLASAATP